MAQDNIIFFVWVTASQKKIRHTSLFFEIDKFNSNFFKIKITHKIQRRQNETQWQKIAGHQKPTTKTASQIRHLQASCFDRDKLKPHYSEI